LANTLPEKYAEEMGKNLDTVVARHSDNNP